MKQSSSTFRNTSIAVTACALLVTSTLCVGSSFAFERNITRTGSNGFSSSKSINTTRTSQGYNRNTTVSGPQGNTATRTAQGQWDSGSKTWSRNATVTGVNGNSATSSSSATRTGSGYNRSTTITGPQGNSGTRNVSGSWDAVSKTWTKTANTTR